MLSAYEIILKKRNGLELSREEIAQVIDGYLKGEIPDYQMSALLMAIFFRGMSPVETWTLTQLFINSGEKIDLSDIPGIKVDKHSTGGVGDKTSILLAPIVAAAGVPVPMISGRGLGHTGGTLDKLESIPGFRIKYSVREFHARLARVGTCLIGPSDQLTPADKKIYALRDVTATIDSTPLIVASIMSKKIAEGTDALVLDIKSGKGAFMKNYQQAYDLAHALIRIGELAAKKTVAYITDMNTPLGSAVGNWLEIRECIECLQGKGKSDLMTLTHQLSGAMIFLGKKAASIEEGKQVSEKMVNTGNAWDKFLQIVREQEGNVDLILHPERYPESKYQQPYFAPEQGWISGIDAMQVGLVAIDLGAGRKKSDDRIDPKAGIIFHKNVGEFLRAGEPVFTLYTDKPAVQIEAVEKIARGITILSKPVAEKSMILGYLDKSILKEN